MQVIMIFMTAATIVAVFGLQQNKCFGPFIFNDLELELIYSCILYLLSTVDWEIFYPR
jgi:hypothetical protein